MKKATPETILLMYDKLESVKLPKGEIIRLDPFISMLKVLGYEVTQQDIVNAGLEVFTNSGALCLRRKITHGRT